MATADKKATAKALVKAAKNAKSPSKGKEPSAPKKEKGTPKNLMTFYVSAKGTVISGHVTPKNKATPYFEFSIDGNQLQLRWAPKGTAAVSLRILKASLAKNSADELCGRIRGKLSPDLFKILRPIFAWLIERVKNDTLDQPKVGRCWREMPKANPTAPDCTKPCLKATVKPATENVFSTAEFVQRTKVWQLAQVTGHDALVCRKMLERHGYDLDAAYAEFLGYAERTAREISGSDS